MSSRLQPRPDQKDAVGAVLDAIRSGHPRAQVIAASGTGKTLLALWILEGSEAAVTIYFAPSLALIRQTALSWFANAAPATQIEALCLCSDETVAEDIPRTEVPTPVTTHPDVVSAFLRGQLPVGTRRIIFCTYQSLTRLEEALASVGIVPDLLLCDEAHRVAGPEGKHFQAVLDSTRIPGRFRIFLTATPRIAATHQDREEADTLLASMDDESRFGPVVYRLSFGDAIKLGLLADYRITILATSDEEVERLVDAGESDHVALAQAAATVRALDAGLFRHALSFHHRRAAATRFADALARQVRQEEHPPCYIGTVFGDMPVARRADVIEAMLRSPRGVISSAKALAEGVDIPAVDAVVFVDPRRSVVEIAQAVGRALRRDPASPSKVASIAIPLVIRDGGDPFAELAGSEWEPVWRVVAALAAHDDRLERDLVLAQHRRAQEDARGGPSGSQRSEYLESALELSLPPGVEPERFRRAIGVRALEEAGDPFEYGFARLEAYVADHESAAVPTNYVEPDGFKLGRWAASLRQLYRAGRLTDDRMRRLEQLAGWWWLRNDHEWLWGIASLRRQVRRHGAVRLPTTWWTPRDGWLGAWVARRRAEYHEGKLPKPHAYALEALPGWGWGEYSALPQEPISSQMLNAPWLQRIRAAAVVRPTPPADLLSPVERPYRRWNQRVPTPAFADWVYRQYVPAVLRHAGMIRWAAAIESRVPLEDGHHARAAERHLDRLAKHVQLLLRHLGGEAGLLHGFSSLLWRPDTLPEVVDGALWPEEWSIHDSAWEEIANLAASARALAALALALATAPEVAAHDMDPRLRALNRLVGWARRRRRHGWYRRSIYDVVPELFDGPLAPASRERALLNQGERELMSRLQHIAMAQELARESRSGRKIARRLLVLPMGERYYPDHSLDALEEASSERRPRSNGAEWRPAGERLSPADKLRLAARAWRDSVEKAWVARMPGEVSYHFFSYLDRPPLKEQLFVEPGGRRFYDDEDADIPDDAFILRVARRRIGKGTSRKVPVLSVPSKRFLEKDRANRLGDLGAALKGATLLAARPVSSIPTADGARVYSGVWIRYTMSLGKQYLLLEEGLLEVREGKIVRAQPAGDGTLPDKSECEVFPSGSTLVVPARIEWDNAPGRWEEAPDDLSNVFPPAEPQPVSRATGSPGRSLMPNGQMVESREERFAVNLAAAKSYFEAHGHLRPSKTDRPEGINLYQWLKNQELQIRRGTMPPRRRAALEDLPGWPERERELVGGSAEE